MIFIDGLLLVVYSFFFQKYHNVHNKIISVNIQKVTTICQRLTVF